VDEEYGEDEADDLLFLGSLKDVDENGGEGDVDELGRDGGAVGEEPKGVEGQVNELRLGHLGLEQRGEALTRRGGVRGAALGGLHVDAVHEGEVGAEGVEFEAADEEGEDGVAEEPLVVGVLEG
jgi:hypothetical protein